MFEDYFREEYGRSCLKNEFGFVLYGIHGEECHLADMYTEPKARKTYEAKKLFTELTEKAKEANCKYITCVVSVLPSRADKATRLLRCFLALGFKAEQASNNNVILFYYL